ncbi:MAG: heavy-metal-associated domain-containing protein [Halanaeroarchaeum sp.]
MSITVTVTDMSCDGCEDIVEGAVADVSGVESVEADRSTDTVTVEGDADVDAILRAIDFAGYTPNEDSVTAGEPAPTETGEVDDDAEATDSETASEDEAGGDEPVEPDDGSDDVENESDDPADAHDADDDE